MTFDDYENGTENTIAQYIRVMGTKGRFIEYGLGLHEESSEVTSIVRKTIKGNFHEQEIDTKHLAEEIGDTFWYITGIVRELPRTTLREVAIKNLEKTHTMHQVDLEQEEDLDIQQYEEKVGNTYRSDLPKSQDNRARYFCLGLIKEIGKVSELLGEYEINSEELNIYKLKEKLGDALWYLVAISKTYNLEFCKIAEQNLQKCSGRYDDEGNARPDEEAR